MTRIDFYILPGQDPAQRSVVACRLAEKAYARGLATYIHTASHRESCLLDDLLWTFRAGSFLPHCLQADAGSEAPPVVVGHDAEPNTHTDMLINLAPTVPPFFGRFERVAEIVYRDDECLEQARKRYLFYKERGYELHSHRLDG